MRKTTFLGLALAFSTVCASQAGIQLDVQGHRGARGLMPENSIPAFREALRLGVPTLELDLQVTQDRKLVVYHDPRLNRKLCVRDDGRRLSNVSIETLRYDELANVDCGRIVDPRFPEQQTIAGTRIPRLEDVLKLARDADYPVRLSIEMKWTKRKDGLTLDEFARRLMTLVQQYALQERTIVQSFQVPALRAVKEIDASIAGAILVRQPDDYARAVKESRATILSPRYDGLKKSDVERFQRMQIKVIPWTVNKIADMCRLIGWGVDGFITDYPNRALELLRTDKCSSNK
jgi:glycerophosphoryl diester phosphodiesterase